MRRRGVKGSVCRSVFEVAKSQNFLVKLVHFCSKIDCVCKEGCDRVKTEILRVIFGCVGTP